MPRDYISIQKARLLRKLTPMSTAKQVGQCLLLYNSTERPGQFIRIHAHIFCRPGADQNLIGAAFWDWLPSEWVAFDWIELADYIKRFELWRGAWSPGIMAPADRAFYDSLPDDGIKVFRGQDRSRPVGLSWTTDRTTGVRFATGNRSHNPNPVVLDTMVRKSDVAFAVTARGEHELVLFEPPMGLVGSSEPI